MLVLNSLKVGESLLFNFNFPGQLFRYVSVRPDSLADCTGLLWVYTSVMVQDGQDFILQAVPVAEIK